MNVVIALLHAIRMGCFFTNPFRPTRNGSLIRRWRCGLLLLGLMGGAAAQAQVVATSVISATDLGRDQIVNVQVDWSRIAPGIGDKITVLIPPQLAVNPPVPPAGCAYNAPNMVCDVPDGASGDAGTLTFPVKGQSIGGFNLTATGTSSPSASFSGTVRSTGDIIVGKIKTSPAGNPVAGSAVVFTLTPQITTGDDVPGGASIVVTDNLPGTVADFNLTNVALTGISGSCNTTAAANASRTLTCTYNGPFTRAALNASTIKLTGTAGNNGSFTNSAAIKSGNANYFDANPNNNSASVNYVVDPGTDLEALGSFPSTAQTTGALQTLVLTHKNNGPLSSPAGGLVQTIVPATFTIGILPAGCSQTPAQSLVVGGTNYPGTLVSCVVGALAVGAQSGFSIPLTMPAAPEASSFPVVVVPPPGRADANVGNNSILLPYQISSPFADLRAQKSKTPGGPQPAGTVVTNTLTIRNDAASTSAAVYDAAHPLRIVDFARPEEVAGGVVTAVSAGWTCTVTTGVTPPAFVGDNARTTRIACENPGPGSLAPNAASVVSFKSTIDAVTAPVELTNRACTGSQALTALGLNDGNGPQPPDGARIGNDCADAGSGLIATPVISGKAQVSIQKESSVDGATFHDLIADAPTLAGAANTLYWRMTITTPTLALNASQETIPTLRLTDTLPGILNVATSGSPAPSFKTPAITVTTTPSTWGSCPNIAAGASALTCAFTNVPAGTTITVLVPVSRALDGGLLTNRATLTSPNAILSTPVAGGQLNDDAAVKVIPQVDVAVTSKTVTPANPLVGQIVKFTITAQNLGPANITGNGQFTITDILFTGMPTLAVPAYEVVAVTPSNPGRMSCAASNLGTGAISCTNTGSINRYEVQTITIDARIKKPAGIGGSAGSAFYTNVENIAHVVLDPALCEFKTEVVSNASVSGVCNDAAATSNNSKTVKFDIKVPAIDLQQGKVAVFPAGQTGFLIGDQLRYRFSVRNAGPSRAEDIVMTDILTVPAGFHITMAAAMPDKINADAANSGYGLAPKAVSCSQAAADANLVCRLNADPLQSYLDAGQEVNFEVALNMTGTATGPVIFGNKVYACADETNAYESSGKCSPDPALAGNNLAAVNNVVFPKADLEVVSKTTVTPSPVDISQPVEYAIVLRNKGTGATTKMRLRDTLPSGFEWLNTGAHQPVVSASGAATLTAGGGLLGVSATVPANGSENVCFISNGITDLTALTQHQEITCDISGDFPPGAANTITLKLFARAKPGLYDGSAPNAPYMTNRTNTATVFPGKDINGDNISVDDKPANNEKTSTVQVQNAQVGGRTFLDLNNNGDQDGMTLVTDQGIGGVTITLTGTDKYGNPVSRTTTTSSAAAGAGSLRGDYLFDNLAPSDAAGYTITQTQPTAYGNGLPQPNVLRPVRNGVSAGVTASGGSYAVSNTATNSVIGGVVLAGGASGVQFDFPETQRPYLSGFVYLDANNDGIKDGSDVGISAVTMTLIGCAAGPNGVLDTVGPIGAGPAACSGDDTPVNKTVLTDGDGYYLFPLDEPGRYSVIEQIAQPSVAGVKTLRGKTTAGSVDLITSPAGANNGGTRGTANATGSVAGGNAGVLEEINVAVAASQLRDIVISNSAAISVNNNFGEILPASIAGVVYTEKGTLNSNYGPGVDWPLPGAKVVLTGTDDLGQTVTLTTTTLADGSYVFNNLRPGLVYQVVKTNPSPSIVNEVGGAFPGKDVGSSVRGVRVDDNTINTIVLESGTNVTKTNFAVVNGPAPVVPVELPHFKLVKSNTGTIQPGQETVYTLKVTNIGTVASSGSLRLSDLLPTGMSLVAGASINSPMGSIGGVVFSGQTVSFDFNPAAPIAPGQSVSITVAVDVSPAAVGNVVNYAVVSGGGDPFVPVPPGPGCTDADHCSADPAIPFKPILKLSKSHSDQFVVGKVGVYTLTILNSGGAPSASLLRLSDLLPNGMSLVAVNPVVSAFGSVANLVVAGQLVKFDLNLATPIAAGQSVTLTVSVDVGLAAVGNMVNYASVSDEIGGNVPPPGPACTDPNHCANNPTVVKGPPVLSLAKSAPPALILGGNAEYVLTVKNTGESPTYGALQLIEKLPLGLLLNGEISSQNGVISNAVTTGSVSEGFVVKFDFLPNQPLVESGGTAAITVPITVGVSTVVGTITNYASVGGGGDIRDSGKPPAPGVDCADPRCANAPSVVAGSAQLSITKTVNKTEVELGDMVSYTVTVANIGNSPVPLPDIIDRLPAGFRLIEGSSRVVGAVLIKLQGMPGPALTYTLDAVQPGKTVTITYRVRVGVGAMEGDGVNRAVAQCRYNSNPNCSNEARARVRVTGGVFTTDACVVGMIYVDCNGNQIKDREELGIPGVRLYAEDGTFLISDSEGKYSYCGFSPKSHVLKVDQVTLPRGSRLVSSSNRNLGDANSLFLDLKNGELQRADFIEGSCSNTVLEQVKARRTQGEVSGPQTEKKGGAALSFEGKAPNYPQQGTDSANQVITKPRISTSAAAAQKPIADTHSERDTPVPQLEINQGVRGAK